MEFNAFVFPAPKLTWRPSDFMGELIFVPRNIEKLEIRNMMANAKRPSLKQASRYLTKQNNGDSGFSITGDSSAGSSVMNEFREYKEYTAFAGTQKSSLKGISINGVSIQPLNLVNVKEMNNKMNEEMNFENYEVSKAQSKQINSSKPFKKSGIKCATSANLFLDSEVRNDKQLIEPPTTNRVPRIHPLKSRITTISSTGMIYTGPAVISHDCQEDISIKYNDIYRKPRKPVGIKSRLSIRNDKTNYRHQPSIRNDYSQSNSHYRDFNTDRLCERHINHTSNDEFVFDTDLYSNMNDASQMQKHDDMNNDRHRHLYVNELNFNLLQEWSSRDMVMPSSRTGRDTNKIGRASCRERVLMPV